MEVKTNSGLNVRSTPGIHENSKGILPIGTLLKIKGGPNCIQALTGAHWWWEVKVIKVTSEKFKYLVGMEGWSAETYTSNNVVFLVFVSPTPTSTPTPSATLAVNLTLTLTPVQP